MARFELGAVFDRSIEIVKRNFATILISGLIINIPIALVGVYNTYAVVGMLRRSADAEVGMLLGFMLRVMLAATVAWVLSYFFTAAVIRVVQLDHEGQPISVAPVLRSVASQLLPLLGASLAVTLVVGVGAVFCIVPGVIALCGLAFAAQIVVIERESAMASLNRSWELTRGLRGWVFLLFVVGLLVLVVVSAPASVLGFILPPIDQGVDFSKVFSEPAAVGPPPDFQPSVNELNLLVSSLVQVVFRTLGGGFMAIVMTMGYIQIRNIKEGVDLLAASRGERDGKA